MLGLFPPSSRVSFFRLLAPAAWTISLPTSVDPAASAGPSFHAAISSGKFHGMICPTTPIGSRSV